MEEQKHLHTTVFTWCAISNTAPPLISSPFIAPTPVPTITAVGVASPKAHGQATTITLIADIRAVTYLSSVDPDSSSSNSAQHEKVTMASIITQGANIEAMRSIQVVSYVVVSKWIQYRA